MIHQQIKELFFSSVEHIVSDISQYAVHPDSDFKRSKKIPAQKLISFLVSQGSSSTRVEMFHTQIGVGNRLEGGRRRVKKYLWSFLRTAPAGAGQAVTCSTSGMGLRLK